MTTVGALAGVLVAAQLLAIREGRARWGEETSPAELTDLETGYPEALNDLLNHVDIADKKSWMTEIYHKAKGAQLLHPLADIDPFTGQPLDGSSHEAILRHHATKAIADQMDEAATADMDAAQQAARDEVGADAGCTHRDLNQTDYAGTQATAVTGQACMDWGTAFADGLSMYATSLYPSLSGNECRNPDGSKLGAWCYLESAANTSADVEGEQWEYCDIGTRCAVDMPILRQEQPSGKMQQLGDVGAAVAHLKLDHGARQARGRHAASKAPKASKTSKASKQGTGGGFAAQAKQGMLPRFSGREARKELQASSWLPTLAQHQGKPSGPSYMSSKAAQEQLRAEGLM